MTAERWRLFIAAPIPGDPAAALWRALEGMRAAHPDVRWMPAEQYHATVLFLGSMPAGEAERLVDGMAQALTGVTPFEAVADRAGGRVGGRRGGVAWLRIGTGRAQLSGLSRRLDEELSAAAFTEREPLPHVTLARRADRTLLDDLRRAQDELEARWRVDRLVLFRSHTGPHGSRYEELAAMPLAG